MFKISRKRSVASVSLLLAAMLGLAACSSEPVAPDPVTETPSPTPDKVEAPSPSPSPTQGPIWPLTGQPLEDESAANHPAVAVKIENTASARPQSGLDQADIVWETIVEFEVSRFIAVFHSQQPEEVGPIRSVRPMDAPLVAANNGILAFSGGQGGIISEVRAADLQTLIYDSGTGGMWRVSHRAAPHNVYGSVPTFLSNADEGRTTPPPAVFEYAITDEEVSATVSGTPAATLNMNLSGHAKPTWTWDEAAGAWLRAEGSTPAVAASGDQLSATNVVYLEVTSSNSSYRAQGGTRVPQYDIVDASGRAVFASGGQVVEGTWTKGGVTDPFIFALEDGSPALLAPGNTWIETAPINRGATLTVE